MPDKEILSYGIPPLLPYPFHLIVYYNTWCSNSTGKGLDLSLFAITFSASLFTLTVFVVYAQFCGLSLLLTNFIQQHRGYHFGVRSTTVTVPPCV
jgi:hypothetical protein